MKKTTIQGRAQRAANGVRKQARNGQHQKSAVSAGRYVTLPVEVDRSLLSRIEAMMKRDKVDVLTVIDAALVALLDSESERWDVNVPLRPLLKPHQYFTPTRDQLAEMEFEAETLWGELAAGFLPGGGPHLEVMEFFNEAAEWYEILRHHPMFRTHALLLRDMIEGSRGLERMLNQVAIDKWTDTVRKAAAALEKGEAA